MPCTGFAACGRVAGRGGDGGAGGGACAADASAAAGPKGRTAEAATDVVMNAEILSYSRSKGLFAGISLEGSTLRSDGGANEKLYRQKLCAKEIIRDGKVKAPPSTSELIALLNKKTPKNKSEPKSLQ